MKKLIIAIAILTACSSAPLEPEEDTCIPQEIAVCACPGWPTGVTTCTDDLEWGECVCEEREHPEPSDLAMCFLRAREGGERYVACDQTVAEEPIEDKRATITRIEGVDPPMGGYGGECAGFYCLGGGARY